MRARVGAAAVVGVVSSTAIAAPAVGVAVDAGMAGQLVGAGEAFAAAGELAGVGLLPRVGPDVSSLMLEAVEGLGAHGALVGSREVVWDLVGLLLVLRPGAVEE